jgi:ADP-ribosylglycohydrolase
MRDILDRIDQGMEQERNIYVHCYGGHGRTATVAGCWMVRHGLSGEEALRAIKKARQHDSYLAGQPSPQTAAQRAFVKGWQNRDADSTMTKTAPAASLGGLSTTSEKDRAVGCLVGLATGDAVGTTVEFSAPGTFPPVTDMVGGGPFRLKGGQWTDDTSMALCLAESLVDRGGFDPADQMTRYCKWWKDGYLSSTGSCFDIGGTTRSSLGKFLKSGNPFSGSTDPHSAGNGALMRLAPVAIAYAGQPATAVVLAGESSRTTHGARESVDACRYFAAVLVGALGGCSKEQILSPAFSPAPGLWEAEPLAGKVADVAAGSYKECQPPDIKGTGYVVKSLEAALWAFHTTTCFRDAVLAATNLGHDTDTTAAICGQVAGAFYGVASIPEAWRAKLALRETIEHLAIQLLSIRQW